MNKIAPPVSGNKQSTLLHLLILWAVTIGCLVPFIGKAYHIDDPLYIWAAQYIHANPFNFYGFDVNWYGNPMPMSEVMKNPPLTSYFIAAVAAVAGWGERALHIAFMLPALFLATGMYLLARRFTSEPLLAALAGIITPVFLVSGTSVMSDVMMLAFWCWAVLLWMKGAEKEDALLLILSALLIAMSALTKYFGMSLIPLLCAYSLFKGHRKRLWMPCMLLTLLLLIGYQWATFELYGRGLLTDAAAYSVTTGSILGSGNIVKALIGLSFAGGCLITVLFYAPLIWSRRTLLFGLAFFVVLTIVLFKLKGLQGLLVVTEEGIDAGLVLHLSIFIIAGLSLVVLSITDFLSRKDPESLLLFFWIAGTFIFAAFLNWTNNGRSNLPMMPAAAMLLVRGIERRYRGQAKENQWKFFLPLIPALVLSIVVARADYVWANTARGAASFINEKYIKRGEHVRFQGHWGFQYYMEGYGARAIDFMKSDLMLGDVVISPENNTNLLEMPEEFFGLIETVKFPLSRWAIVMSPHYPAGFYMSIEGPLPYLIGYSDDDVYNIYVFRG